MPADPKELVEQGYDRIAECYLSWVQSQPSPRERYATKVLDNAPASSPRVLELGCGAGYPITRMLLDRGAQVVANDISARQLELAKARCPQATFLLGDMTALSFEPASFDGVVSFFSIAHLPRREHQAMFSKIHAWLRPGGMFVFNLSAVDEEEMHGDFLGHHMFWSSHGVEESQALVNGAGFEVVEADVLEAGDGLLDEDDPDYGVKFLWIVARKGLGI